jgi:hypothetical protein
MSCLCERDNLDHVETADLGGGVKLDSYHCPVCGTWFYVEFDVNQADGERGRSRETGDALTLRTWWYISRTITMNFWPPEAERVLMSEYTTSEYYTGEGRQIIRVEAIEPIPGTNLYRRWENGEEVSPEYRGPDTWEFSAQEQAGEHGYRSVAIGRMAWARFPDGWYFWGYEQAAATNNQA